MPTSAEVELHNATHVPFRSWCAFCVAGKAKCNPHFRKATDRVSGVRVVDIDYAFLGQEGDLKPDEVEEDEISVPAVSSSGTETQPDAVCLTVLVLRDRDSKYVTASVVPRKGDHPYTVHRVGHDISNILGYKRVVLKSDQEPAIKKLKATVRREYSLEAPDEYSAVGDSQSNGEIEITVQLVEGQVRTLKCQLESRVKQVMPAGHNLMPWLVRHAGATISRYQKGRDGMTGYRRLRGRDYDRPIVEFAECVWYLKSKNRRKGKIDPRWATGVYLGASEDSPEVLIGTPEGVLKVRSIRRQGSAEDRWNTDLIMGILGVPWQPSPGVNTFEIKSNVQFPTDIPEDETVPVNREFATRKLYIKKKDIEKYGLSVGCPGCDAILRRDPKARTHSEACRSRIVKS
jgi:hypothetical protein